MENKIKLENKLIRTDLVVKLINKKRGITINPRFYKF